MNLTDTIYRQGDVSLVRCEEIPADLADIIESGGRLAAQ